MGLRYSAERRTTSYDCTFEWTRICSSSGCGSLVICSFRWREKPFSFWCRPIWSARTEHPKTFYPFSTNPLCRARTPTSTTCSCTSTIATVLTTASHITCERSKSALPKWSDASSNWIYASKGCHDELDVFNTVTNVSIRHRD